MDGLAGYESRFFFVFFFLAIPSTLSFLLLLLLLFFLFGSETRNVSISLETQRISTFGLSSTFQAHPLHFVGNILYKLLVTTK